MLKIALFLLFIANFVSFSQNTTVDFVENELLPTMNNAQRLSISSFESIKVIDIDDECTLIFKNNKWQRLFPKEDLNQAKEADLARLNKNESWKKFDEESRPQNGNSILNRSITAESSAQSISKNITFRYDVVSNEILEKKGFHFSFQTQEKIAYLKIYTNDFSIDLDGFNHLSFKEENSILIRPNEELSKNTPINLVKNEGYKTSLLTDLSSIKGILVAYVK